MGRTRREILDYHKRWRDSHPEYMARVAGAWRRKYPERYSWVVYQRNAKNRGLPWQLGQEDFNVLIHSDCHYCGKRPTHRPNGVDRMDNGVGYIPFNCVACCSTCNHMKGTLSHDEFIAHCIKIAEHCDLL